MNLKNKQSRKLVWDDENRLVSSSDNGQKTEFLYDASGERTFKIGKQGSTVYVNQFYVVRNESIASKHFYAGKQRIATKLVGGVKNVDNFIAHGPNGGQNIKSNNEGKKAAKQDFGPNGKGQKGKGKNLEKQRGKSGINGKSAQNGRAKGKSSEGNEGKKAARQASGPNGNGNGKPDKGDPDPDGNGKGKPMKNGNQNGRFADGSQPGHESQKAAKRAFWSNQEHRSDRANEVANGLGGTALRSTT